MRQPDWSLLHPELIQYISEKIPCIIDYVYFRAVCWAWRLASLSKPRHLPPQLPWLLLPITSNYEIVTNPEILFYDLYRSKRSTLGHPAIVGSRIKGASFGWLILEKNQDVILLNPVSRASIPVSSLSDVPNIFPIPENSELCPTDWIIDEEGARYGYLSKAILTSTPSDSGCMVVGLFASNWMIAFCRIGDECWTLIEEYDYDYYEWAPLIEDIAWHHNLLYAIDATGGVCIYDLYSPSKQFVLASVEHIIQGAMFLVEGASEPMAVIQHSPIMRETLELEHEVFKWRNEGKPAWLHVHDIGNTVLFLSNFPRHCLSIPCSYFQSNRWHGSQVCSEKRGSSTVVAIELKELQEGQEGDADDVANLEDLGRGYFDTSFWMTPSFF